MYSDLKDITDARVSGLPSDLVARRARCALLDELRRTGERTAEARALHADLIAARWPLDEGTFFSYADQVAQWAGLEPSLPRDRMGLSAAATWAWQEWTAAGRGELRSAGRRSRAFEGIDVTLLWQDYQPMKLVDLLRWRDPTRILRTDDGQGRAAAHASDDSIRTDSHTP